MDPEGQGYGPFCLRAKSVPPANTEQKTRRSNEMELCNIHPGRNFTVGSLAV
jgi:hypothetical protein